VGGKDDRKQNTLVPLVGTFSGRYTDTKNEIIFWFLPVLHGFHPANFGVQVPETSNTQF
jgi:hypothetical protein